MRSAQVGHARAGARHGSRTAAEVGTTTKAGASTTCATTTNCSAAASASHGSAAGTTPATASTKSTSPDRWRRNDSDGKYQPRKRSKNSPAVQPMERPQAKRTTGTLASFCANSTANFTRKLTASVIRDGILGIKHHHSPEPIGCVWIVGSLEPFSDESTRTTVTGTPLGNGSPARLRPNSLTFNVLSSTWRIT
ncbi:hypothetical protein SAMN06265222_101796 [Neorhodopirellula lusitana]|uniref:Uncharacterized protein n=1 Tax=Neorhodopirellula lusitana TaxID=445327 RepID=A0ABY1PRI3_9BACT|nr:hypothetical protein SAMN06265222_101796 [Neorhodopirellula lusitana]